MSSDAPAAAPDTRADAEHWKKLGNDKLKEGNKTGYISAVECYTRGIAACGSDASKLRSQLHSNRAHVNILLRKFVDAVDDCRKAIAADPTNIKPYWRGARASHFLSLFQQASEFCESGLQVDSSNDELIKLKTAAEKELQAVKARRETASASKPEYNPQEAMELKGKINDLEDRIDNMKMLAHGKERDRRRMALTIQHVTSEDIKDSRLFRPVGRCFLLTSGDSLVEQFNAECKAIVEELPKLQAAIQDLESRKDKTQNELLEMMRGGSAK